MLFIKLFLLGIVLQMCYCNEDVAVISTPQGKFQGYIRSLETFGNKYRVGRFLGVPYAEPPVGSKRFKKPERKAAHTGIYEANTRGAACPQLEIHAGGKRNINLKVIFSEDCLYLNIFTPTFPVSEQKLPVMIFIHGGGFNVGFSDYSAGDILSAYGNVIVVTLNYRLNVWGFLSTGDKYLPGNYGLWDQQMAIQWVHENIAHFGGDPNQVTIFGHSAGSASVIYQSMYPGNDGLFKRVIALSGSITCPWAFNENPLAATRRFGAILGCQEEDTKDLSKCIESKSAGELHNALNNNNGFNTFPLDFVSVNDGDFLPLSPKEIFYGSSEIAKQRRRLFAEKEFMTGVVSNEGLLMINPWAGITNDTENFRVDRTELESKYVPDIVRIMFGTSTTSTINNLLAAEYTNWNDPNDETNSMASFLRLSSDYTFNIQAVETLKLYNSISNKKSFAYIMDAFPSQHILWTPTWASKPNHGDELTFIFGYDSEDGITSWTEPYDDRKPSEWEINLSKAIITMWTNFAKSGNPNSPESLTPFGIEWPAFGNEAEAFLNISSNNVFTVGHKMFARSYNFWMNVLPEVISDINKAVSKLPEQQYCDKEESCSP